MHHISKQEIKGGGGVVTSDDNTDDNPEDDPIVEDNFICRTIRRISEYNLHLNYYGGFWRITPLLRPAHLRGQPYFGGQPPF